MRYGSSRQVEMMNLSPSVRTLVVHDRLVTLREIIKEVVISIGLVRLIWTENLAMRRVSVKFVAKSINDGVKTIPFGNLMGYFVLCKQ